MSEAYALEPETPQEDAGEPQGQSTPWVLSAVGKPNLAFDLPASILTAMGAKVCEEFDIDIASREAAQYEQKLERAVKLATLATEGKSTPWENASNVKFPLVIQAAIQFNARSYAAVVDGPNVVKCATEGAPSPEKQARAERVGNHMSWQLLNEEEEWEEDTDGLLIRLPVVGTLFRKRYFDPVLGRNCSHVLGPDEFVVNYKAKRDLSVVPRATHIISFYPHEITEKRRSGLWLDIDLGTATDAANDDQAPHVFLEQYRLWDLDDDGYPEPYIVTVHKETQRVVRVVARWYKTGVTTNQKGEISRIQPYECVTKYGFIPNPDGSFYDLGFGLLLGPLSDTIDTALNQLMDAATLANLQGGFIGEGVSIKSGNMRFRPGEWKKAGIASGANLSQSIVPLPTKEPSSVLFELMQFLIETAKDVTATQDILTGDAGKGTMPVGTVQALVEQGLKTFTAIVKRIHRSFKRELRIQYELNARYLDPQVYFNFQDVPQQVGLEDYRAGDLDIVPVSDPNMATDLQRMGQAQFVMSLIGTGQVNPREAVSRALVAAHVANPDGLMIPQGPPPPDPKLIAEQAKDEREHRKLDIQEHLAHATVAEKMANAQSLMTQSVMADPRIQALIAQIVDQRTAAAEGTDDGPGPQVQPGDVPGMGQSSADPGLQGPAPGFQGPAGGPMGQGPGDGPAPAMQGAPPGGIGQPQLG